MNEHNITCPVCGRVFTSTIHSYTVQFIQNLGKCEDCALKAKGLIKVDDHYVPWSYRNSLDPNGSEEPAEDSDFFEDKNAKLPFVEVENGLLKITFHGADGGGYDVQEFIWYFNTWDDIIKAMTKKRDAKNDE